MDIYLKEIIARAEKELARVKKEKENLVNKKYDLSDKISFAIDTEWRGYYKGAEESISNILLDLRGFEQDIKERSK